MIRLQAPAKLNLFLRVLGKRADGYHEIETVFERIDLADELTIEPSGDLRLTCTDPTLSCGEDNLVIKAARLLHAATKTTRGARMHVTKRIPIAAGLGGGSSDAAATLLGLNELWGLQLPQAELIRLGAELGSDVPFFLSGAARAIGRGRGERCELLAVTAPLAYLLITPDSGLSTREIYEHSDFSLTVPKPPLTIIQHALNNGPAMAGLASGLWNDLQPEAIRRCPIIATIQSRLRESGCLGSLMSGSGPSVFGLCRSREQAQAVADQVRRHAASSWRIGVVETAVTINSGSIPTRIRCGPSSAVIGE